MKPERNTTIDFLRGLSILIMVITHVTVYYLNEKVTAVIWNYSHFVVPIFIFCSAFIYFEKKSDAPFNIQYVWKRAKRLLIPYYVFLIPFFTYFYFLDKKSFTILTMQKFVFLMGYQDLDWLVVLFLYILFLLPFIRFLSTKKLWLWIFTIISFASSIALIFMRLPIHFRLYMWLPWSMILLFTYFITRFKNKKKVFIYSALVWFFVFLIGRFAIMSFHKSLIFTDNKYPPNLYYLSYGMFWISVWYLIHSSVKTPKIIQTFFDFLSRYSYTLFFIHFLYLYILVGVVHIRNYPWWSVTMFLLITSCITQILLNYVFDIKRLTFFRR